MDRVPSHRRDTPKLDPNSPDGKAHRADACSARLSDDVFGQYVGWLEDELGTNVNQAALAQAVGSGAPDTN